MEKTPVRILNIIETAYRATLEEQDDTVVWMSHALKGAGAELDVVLQGSAVNYAVITQDATGLKIGGLPQTQPPDLAGDVLDLMEKGCRVYVLSEDLSERGIEEDSTVEGISRISRGELAACLDNYQQVWQW